MGAKIRRSFYWIAARTALILSASLLCTSAALGNAPAHNGDPQMPVAAPDGPDQLITDEIADPVGSDPLTPSELSRAIQAVAPGDPSLLPQARAASAGATASATTPDKRLKKLKDLQFLYAQRHEDEKGATDGVRRADVFFYDYKKDVAIQQIVNLKTGAVEAVIELRDWQPAATSLEATAAVQLLLDHAQLGDSLRRMHRAAHGADLTSAADVNAHAGLFFAEGARDTRLEAVTKSCKKHRCIQLFIPYDDTHFIDTSMIVIDLSAAKVLWVEEPLTAYLDGVPLRVIQDTLAPVEVQ